MDAQARHRLEIIVEKCTPKYNGSKTMEARIDVRPNSSGKCELSRGVIPTPVDLLRDLLNNVAVGERAQLDN